MTDLSKTDRPPRAVSCHHPTTTLHLPTPPTYPSSTRPALVFRTREGHLSGQALAWPVPPGALRARHARRARFVVVSSLINVELSQSLPSVNQQPQTTASLLSRWTLIWTRSTIRMPRRFALRCAPSTTTLRRGCCQRLRLHGCVASTASFSLSWRNARQMRRSSRLWAALARLVSVAAAARAEIWQRGLCCRHRKWSLYHCKWSLYRRRSLSPIG